MVLATLEPINSSNDPTVYPVLSLEKPSVILGRAADKCDILINTSKSISMVHCRFDQKNGKWLVTDLKSMNGTLINETRIKDGGSMEVLDNNVLKFAFDSVSYRFKVNKTLDKTDGKDVLSFPTATGTKVVTLTDTLDSSIAESAASLSFEEEQDQYEPIQQEHQKNRLPDQILSNKHHDKISQQASMNESDHELDHELDNELDNELDHESDQSLHSPVHQASVEQNDIKLLRERVEQLENTIKNVTTQKQPQVPPPIKTKKAPPRRARSPKIPQQANVPSPPQSRPIIENNDELGRSSPVSIQQYSPTKSVQQQYKDDDQYEKLIKLILDLTRKLSKQMGVSQHIRDDDNHLLQIKSLIQNMMINYSDNAQQLHDLGLERYAHDLERQLIVNQVEQQEPLPPLPSDLDQFLRDELEFKHDQIIQLHNQIADMNTSRYSNTESKMRMHRTILNQLTELENTKRQLFEFEKRYEHATLSWNALIDERDRLYERIKDLTGTIQGQMSDTHVLVMQKEQQINIWRSKFIELSSEGNDQRRRAAEFIIGQLQASQSQINQQLVDNQDIKRQISMTRMENNELKLEINRLSDMLKLTEHDESLHDKIKQMEMEGNVKRVSSLQETVSTLQVRLIRAEKTNQMIMDKLGHDISDDDHLVQTQARCIAYLEKLVNNRDKQIERMSMVVPPQPTSTMPPDHNAIEQANEKLLHLQKQVEQESTSPD
jgi:pSer/pThr/pTyr-binding forkhead associated (FHA) protein